MERPKIGGLRVDIISGQLITTAYNFADLVKKIFSRFRINDPIVFNCCLFHVENSLLCPQERRTEYLEDLSEAVRAGVTTIWVKKHLEPQPNLVRNDFDVNEAYHRLADPIWNAYGRKKAPQFPGT